MATYSKPDSIPYWADDEVNNVEPPEAKKSLGWVFGEEPASSIENWKSNLIGKWFRWLDERFSDDDETNDTLVVNVGDSLRIKAADEIRAQFGENSFIGASTSDGFVFVNGATDKEFRFGNSQKKLSYNITDNELDFFFGDATPTTRLSFPGITTVGGVYIGANSTAHEAWPKDLRVVGGSNVGGSTNPLPGVGIFSTGVAAGYDGSSPAFGAGFGDAGNTIVLDADGNPLWTTDTGDFIKFKRAENRFGFVIADAEQQRVDVDGITYRHGTRTRGIHPAHFGRTVGGWIFNGLSCTITNDTDRLFIPLEIDCARYIESVIFYMSANTGSIDTSLELRKRDYGDGGAAGDDSIVATSVVTVTGGSGVETPYTLNVNALLIPGQRFTLTAGRVSGSTNQLSCQGVEINYKKITQVIA